MGSENPSLPKILWWIGLQQALEVLFKNQRTAQTIAIFTTQHKRYIKTYRCEKFSGFLQKLTFYNNCIASE